MKLCNKIKKGDFIQVYTDTSKVYSGIIDYISNREDILILSPIKEDNPILKDVTGVILIKYKLITSLSGIKDLTIINEV